MVRGDTIGPAIIRWAEREPSIGALVLIGSRVHAGASSVTAADELSDWDFQVVTSRPELFVTAGWTRDAGLGEPLAYVARSGRLGAATKVSVVLRDGELDLVLLPVRRLKWAKFLLRIGLATRLPALRTALSGLAGVLRDGHRLVIGEREWGRFFSQVVAAFPPMRLSNAAVRSLAEGFVCDYVSTSHKIKRGEFLAAQRWVHLQLAEVNFQLLHELRQRRGEPSLPDGRRIERLPVDSRGIAVSALPTQDSLHAAAEKSAATLRELMSELVPDWRWPNLPQNHLEPHATRAS
jgi:hypothetical protein